MKVAGLLLAAGAGRRMGRPKALVELDGEPLVRRGIRLLRDGGCDPVLVVVGAAADRVRPLCGDATVVEAVDWETGMGASLRAGLTALQDHDLPGRAGGAPVVESCVVALVDQPLVTPDAVARLRAAARDGATAAVATYDGRGRNPVLLSRATWPQVRAAAVGDEGARGWLREHPDLVVPVDCTDVGAPDDVDTPQELAVLRRRSGDRLPAASALDAHALDPHALDPHALDPHARREAAR